MKKQILTIATITLALGAQAQVADTVTMGAGYANQVWYSLANDEQGTKPKNEWDLAFDIKDIMSTIHVNSVNGVKLWGYPKSDATGWSSVDTNGLSTWTDRTNSDTSWSIGAMGRYADPNNANDLDWGKYNMTTHIVTGDSLYIIKLANGDYKKLLIEKLASGKYTFKYADLNGANEKTPVIDKTIYTGKNFAYYSLQNNTELNREPDADKWDLLFTQYTAYVPSAYTVTGVLHNRGVFVEKASNLPNKNTYVAWGTNPTTTAINTIGYNWKSYNMAQSKYDIKDSTVFFIYTQGGPTKGGGLWKVIMTGFESAQGKQMFSKQQLVAASVNDATGNEAAAIAVYPNPAKNSNVTLVYTLNSNNEKALAVVYDMQGRVIHMAALQTATGLHQYVLPTSTFAPGMYLVSVKTDAGEAVQKLIVQ